MAFNAKIKAEILKTLIDVTSPLVSEVKLNIKKEGVSLRAVDPAHVALVDLHIGKEAFEEYRADETELGIDIDKLSGILKLSSSNDIVSLEYDEKDNRLIVKIGNLTRKMALIDTTGMPDPKMPTLDLPGKVVLKASEITKGIKASEAVSDHLALIVTEDSFEVFAEGDTDIVNLKISKDDLIEHSTDGKYKSLFSIDYLSNMVKPVKSDEVVTINVGNDNPTRLEFDIADSKGHVTYLLAPRIEAE